MVTLSIQATADVLQQGNLEVALYASVGGVWSYFDGTAYHPISASVPPFATISATGAQSWSLPDTTASSGAMILGIGGLPPILSSGNPTEPDPIAVPTTYDVVEFSYTAAAGDDLSNVYVNTTNVDQFGIPITIQIAPPALNLPNGAGVTLDRGDVFTQFSTLVGSGAFAQCLQDPFGNAVAQRILSPWYALQSSGVAGVVANALPNVTGTLPVGTYYYAVTALGTFDGTPVESYAQYTVAQYAVAAVGDTVNVAWENPQPWAAGITGYNVYRGTPSGATVSWGHIAQNLSPDTLSLPGGDTGLPLLDGDAPPLNPLNTFFDDVLQTLFDTYTGEQTLSLASQDDTTGPTYFYAFQGANGSDANGSAVLQFTLQSVTDASGNAVTNPPVPLQTAFNVYDPFWNTNTYNPTLPDPPAVYTANASYAPDVAVPPSAMVFSCAAVFADNALQTAPKGANSVVFSNLLGNLENQIVSAVTRGVATSATVSPSNWGNNTAPVMTGAVPAPLPQGQTSGLTADTPYFYVVTALNAAGETICSLEFTATPTEAQPCVQVSWSAMNAPAVTGFNVYRGTASGQENAALYVANATPPVTSYVDCGAAGTSQTPPAYYPAGGTWPLYDYFFHQPSVSLQGASYAFQYDDQNNESSTLSTSSPTALSISVGPWSAAG